mgnify:FL=1
MKFEQYSKRYEKIKEKQKKLEEELATLKSEYLKGCKFKAGDKVKLTLSIFSLNNEPSKTEDKILYISHVGYGKFDAYKNIQLEFNELKKDGTMSSRNAHIPMAQIKEIIKVS